MSYVVIARRWRPQQFDEIIGQEHVSKTLSNAIANNRIAHSYIFTGPRGVGKTTTARILAKAVNCEKGPTAHPCNECSSCKAITTGNSMDVLEIDGASNRGIDEVRNLRENIRYTPTQGKYRIYIIDEVHMLTKEAFNALLKTLEEPPEHAMFIFATTEIHRVPATILSRCQRFDFRRIPLKTIMEHLRRICDGEKIDIQEEALLQIAKKADGSMRDAQSILDQLISFSGNSIAFEDVAQALGVIHQDLFFRISDFIREGNLKELILLSREVFTSGYDLNEFLLGLEEHLRNILIAKSTGSTEYIDVSENFLEKYRKNADIFSENDLIAYLHVLGDTINQVRNSQQPQLKFELGLLKLAKLPQAADINTLLEKLELLKKKARHNTSLSKEPSYDYQTASEAPAEIPLDLNALNQTWQGIVNDYAQLKATVAATLYKGTLEKFEAPYLHIRMKQVNAFEQRRMESEKAAIEKLFTGETQQIIKIKFLYEAVETKNTKEHTQEDKKSKEEIVKIIREQGGEVISRAIDELDLELI